MRRAHSAGRVSLLALASALVVLFSLAAPAGTGAAPGDIGYEGPSFAGLSGAATAEKPESKLWWNDGQWWASMWAAGTGGHWIHRLDLTTQTWVNTGIALDPRASRADTLWDAASGKLYVASHDYSSSGGTFSPGARLYRFSYNPGTDAYAPDAGFPVTINAARSESLVIDRDSSGQLWATWVQSQRVYVNRSLCNPVCNDAAWGAPFIPSVSGTHPNSTTVSSDDVSSIIAFGNNRIGVIWSNQAQDASYFSTHDDGAGDTTWQASEQLFQGSDEADDHINLATLLADDGGRVFVVTKTSHTAANAPSLKVLERNPSTGAWTSYTYSTRQYDQTRPIVLIDESAGRLHVFSSDEGGGGIYHKSTPLSNISFADGKGTLVMWDNDSQEINDATSTKQNLNSATGMVILASNNVTDRYWHYFDPLGGTPPPPPAPVASFSAAPTSGVGPLTVSFTDTSTNSPTAWAWDFDNNGTVDSTSQHPQHTYTAAGSYSVTLTASSAAGSGTLTKSAFITVGPGGGGGTQTFTAVADAKVGSDQPTRNHGTTADLRIRTGSSNSWNSYLRFDVAGLGGPASSAVLRLHVTSGTPSGGGVHLVSNSWTEGGITWNTAPLIAGAPLDSVGAVTTGTWVEWDVTDAITGNGTFSLAIKNAGGSGTYASRETANRPQLVVNSSGTPPPPPAPVANFSATPVSGVVPLTVSFTDTSTNTPTIWAWDFDNNGTVDSTAQHPQRTYTAPGSYNVRLVATNAGGSGTVTKNAFITVGGPPPPAPVANFSATPVSGVVPLTVSFTDTSTNTPTIWAWDFDNNGTVDSTAQHPQRTYTAPGSYNVRLVATNAGGSGTVTKNAFITVGSGGGGGTLTFTAVADAKVGSDTPTKNYGTTADLRIRTASSNSWNSYLRFNVTGASGPVSSAVLRLYVTSGTASGGGIHAVANTWTESGITWANAPVITGSPLDSVGAVTTGTWVEWDVTDAITGNGTFNLAIRNAGGSGTYSSREGSNPPQLVVTTGG